MIMEATERRKNNYFDGLPVHKRQIILFLIISGAYFFEQVDNAILGFVAPAVMKTFQIGMAEFAPAQSIYFIGMMLGGLFGGIISDFIGRRKAFLGSIAVFSVACILNGFTSHFGVFVISRAITGLGIFSMTVVAVTYLAEITPAESRAKWQGICAGVGFFAAPFVGFIATKVVPMGPETWRYIFYFGGVGIVTFFLGLAFLKESPRWLVTKGRIAEAEAIVYELSGVNVDLSDMATTKEGTAQERVKTSEAFMGMFKGKYLKRTIIGTIVTIGVTIPSFILMGWNPTLLQMNGISQTQSLMISTLGSFGFPIGVLLSSYFGGMGGRKIPIGVSGLIYTAAIIAYVSIGNHFAVLSGLYVIIQGSGMFCSFVVMAYIAESFPTAIRNTATGALNAFARLCVSGAQMIVPILYASFGFAGLGVFMVTLTSVGALSVLIFGWKTGKQSLENVC